MCFRDPWQSRTTIVTCSFFIFFCFLIRLTSRLQYDFFSSFSFNVDLLCFWLSPSRMASYKLCRSPICLLQCSGFTTITFGSKPFQMSCHFPYLRFVLFFLWKICRVYTLLATGVTIHFTIMNVFLEFFSVYRPCQIQSLEYFDLVPCERTVKLLCCLDPGLLIQSSSLYFITLASTCWLVCERHWAYCAVFVRMFWFLPTTRFNGDLADLVVWLNYGMRSTVSLQWQVYSRVWRIWVCCWI